jgi:putative toxin-antitoxin system antitoxin component (TIGR02293 family)
MASESATGILHELAERGFSEAELSGLIAYRRTLGRRRRAGGNLSPEESDRAIRLVRLAAMAERVFGDGEKARRWMRKPSPTLQGSMPLALLKTEAGALLVEQALHRIDYGMLA